MKESRSSASSSSNTFSTPNKRKYIQQIANHLEMEEEEEMTTTDDEHESDKSGMKDNATEPLRPEHTEAEKTETCNGNSIGKEDEEVDQSDEEDTEEEDDDEEEKVEMLALTRSRRPNAGRKMAELMAHQMTEKDEFYISAYGGFDEGEQDDDFASPPHTSDEEEEVDSDFDKPEEEDDEISTFQAEEDPERAERRKKALKQKRLLERNKNWAIARINKMAVPENTCDSKTQHQRLEEAKMTAELNIASLKRFEDLELERKKRRTKPTKCTKLEGPRIKELWTPDGRHLITLPDILSKEHQFPRPERKEYRVCAVTGQEARYIDPLTRLPYADARAFRLLRDKYKQFLMREKHLKRMVPMARTQSSQIPVGDEGFARQPTPAKQRKMLATVTLSSQQMTSSQAMPKVRLPHRAAMVDVVRVDDL